MQWASAISERPEFTDALDECVIAVRDQMQSKEPHVAVVFASPHHDQPGESPPAAVKERFPEAVVMGCMAAGVIGAGHEVEHRPALSLTAAHLPGVSVNGFHVTNESLPSPDDPPDRWAQLLSTPLDADPHFVILADPFSVQVEALIEGLDFAFPTAAKIGGLASGGRRDHALYLNDQVLREGAVGAALSGDVVLDTIVAQGCRPIGNPMRVTQVERNLIVSMDGEAPLEALQRLFETLPARDQELVQRNLFLGVAMDPLLEEVRQGDFLIRNVIGIDPQRGAVAVGAFPREGQIVQFHVRDVDTSSEDLRASLYNYLTARRPHGQGALLFSCTGRGKYLYGKPDHDTGMFRELIGDLPLGGFFCNGEIGPVSGVTHLHGYTSSFGIFRPKGY